MIHFGVYNHLIADGKCWESIEDTRRLITKEVDCMLDAKTSSISLNANKTFSANHLLNGSSNGIVELFKGEQLEHI